jgi:arylsulfatase A-like enzyme
MTLAVGLAAASACGPAPPHARPPDVLLVVVDTLRADRTSVLLDDPSVTPWLRAAGARGTVFRQAIAPAAWTLPSMASLFAGRDAAGNRHAAHADVPALAERFAAAGYVTVGLSANPLLSPDNGFARGFQRFEAAPAASVTDLRAHPADLRAWDAEALVARALREAAATPRDQPLFLWLQLMDTHVPYDQANEPLAGPREGWSAPRPQPPLWDAWKPELAAEEAALLAGWRRAYDAQVAFADAALARLDANWAAVREGEPLLAITSDHGEGLFDHARNPDSPSGPGPLGAAYEDHGEQLFEEALRVPLVLAGPGVPAGRVEERAVPSHALGPTLLRLSGLPRDDDGLPLSAAERAPATLRGSGTRGWYVRRGGRVLLAPFPERSGRAGVLPLLLPVEPGRLLLRQADLSAHEPDVARELRRALDDWLAAEGAQGAPPPDPATRERLQALGYLR